MKRGLLAACLLLCGAAACLAEARTYRIGAVPKEWKLPPIEKPPSPSSPAPSGAFQGRGLGPVSKWDRDFSGPVGSSGFGLPLGSGVVPEGPTHGDPAKPSGASAQAAAEPALLTGTILADCMPGQIFLQRRANSTSYDYLARKGLTFTLELTGDELVGVIRTAPRPHPKELILSIVLGGVVPDGLVFRQEGVKDGLKVEVWKEGGLPRILLKKKPSDGALVEAVLMRPGSRRPSSRWQVKEWKEGRPSKIVSDQGLYTLESTAPSQERTPNDIFGRDLKILDQRAPLESGNAEVVYPWKGQLIDVAALKRLDREKESPLPGWIRGPQSAANGAILLVGLCGLLFAAVLLSRRFGKPLQK